MNIANEITYVATDRAAPEDPLGAASRTAHGQVTEYCAKDSKLTGADRGGGEAAHGLRRLPQPADAHLRSARPRRRYGALLSGKIDTTLPFIKQQAVTA